ncbi:MAG: phosphoribosylamine--glycine ligase [Candidatus Hodarchaeales archaeon]
MKVLLVGNGAREHAIAKAIHKSDQEIELTSFMNRKNPGITGLSHKVILGDLTDFSKLKGIRADIAYIGPENPLASGIVDFLTENGIKAVGPDRICSLLESSKIYCRELLSKYNIDSNPAHSICRSVEDIVSAFSTFSSSVVKPDGLTGGKGVKVQGDHFHTVDEGIKLAKSLLKDDGGVLVEEKVQGVEFTLQAYVSKDGSFSFMPLVKDYKRAYDGDKGPNTGSMGSYSLSDHSLPFVSDSQLDETKRVMKSTVEALKKETGRPFCGILYGQFILSEERRKPVLLEYNVRFGDPESINVLSILEDDIVEIGDKMVSGKNIACLTNYRSEATVCVYLVPLGYPDKPVTDDEIIIPRDIHSSIYYASVSGELGSQKVHTTGSRAIALLSRAKTVKQAHSSVMKDIERFSGPVSFRSDIGLI